jgi:hypothetical protein
LIDISIPAVICTYEGREHVKREGEGEEEEGEGEGEEKKKERKEATSRLQTDINQYKKRQYSKLLIQQP